MPARASLGIPLSALRTFEAIVRLGSLTAAGEELGLTVSAISHQMRGLETAFGQSLLRREGRGVLPTDMGRTLAGDLGRAFGEIDLAIDRTRSARRTVTVSVQASFAARWLIPRLHRFDRIAPGIDLRILTTTRLVNLTREGVDCAIRLGPGDWPDVTATLLMPHMEGPVARAGLSSDARLPRLLLEGRADEWTPWEGLKTGPVVRTLPTRELVIDAVLAGAGVGILDMAVIAAELGRAELEILAPPRAGGWAYYFIVPADAQARKEVKAFSQWVSEEAGF
ncbi:MAG: LysR substrate-binding domain-containing protein [Pseudomonadota bacterium]|jgi:LysR family glycine cleavage system transcriptional activator